MIIMPKRCCEKCKHWKDGEENLRHKKDRRPGKCRRHPPQIISLLSGTIDGARDTSISSCWPGTRNYECCGEWEVKEESS